MLEEVRRRNRNTYQWKNPKPPNQGEKTVSDQALKIVSLEAENVKRLRAVEIQPDGDLVVIGGKNAAGKSSVLDSIWLALGGGKAGRETPQPIRDGETKASVRLDLGDLVVTRTWTESGTKLKVESAEGAEFKSPQTMLDALVGQLSFDPLAFTRLTPKEQRNALIDLTGVDLDSIDAEARKIYAQRTQVGRDGKAIGDIEVDQSLPETEESASELITQIQDAQQTQRRLEHSRDHLAELERSIAEDRAEIEEIKRSIAESEKLAAYLRGELASTEEVDAEPLQERLAKVEETNQKIRANNQARDKQEAKDRLRNLYQQLTDQLADLDKEKAAALADAKFPVAGLGFDDAGVTYQGVPLQQASSAEQIRVSLAMGMALNPRLRVLMIKDGSLLDADSLEAIHKQVADKGFQLWLEIVDPDDPSAVIIEDGQVA